MTQIQHYDYVSLSSNPSKGHLWDSLDIFGEIYWDTPRQIFTLSLINQTVCTVDI